MGGRNNPATKRAYYERKKAEQGLTVRRQQQQQAAARLSRVLMVERAHRARRLDLDGLYEGMQRAAAPQQLPSSP